MSNTPDKKYHWSFYLLAPLLSATLTVLVVEAVLILFYPVPFSMEQNMYYEPDPFVGYKLKPNSLGHFQNGIVARTDRHGHRDDEVALVKDPQVCRVLVLGDSFTMGSNVTREEAYPQVLEQMLNQHFASPVEVINTAVGGWTPFQYAQYYQQYGRAFDPDLVFVGFFVGNDTYSQQNNVEQTKTAVLGRRVFREAAASPWIGLKVWMVDHSHLARLILNTRAIAAIDRTRDTCQDFTTEYVAIQRARIRAHLKRTETHDASIQNTLVQLLRIKALAEQDTASLMVALLPDENQINAHLQALTIAPEAVNDYDFEMPQSLIVEVFEENHIPTIDLFPTFRDHPGCLYMNDTHWNPEGHRLAASTLYRAMLERLAEACALPSEEDAPQ